MKYFTTIRCNKTNKCKLYNTKLDTKNEKCTDKERVYYEHTTYCSFVLL